MVKKVKLQWSLGRRGSTSSDIGLNNNETHRIRRQGIISAWSTQLGIRPLAAIRLFKKSESLLKRVQKAKAEGGKVELNLSQKDDTLDLTTRPIAFDIVPGDLCLHLIFNAGESLDPNAQEMLSQAKKIIDRLTKKK